MTTDVLPRRIWSYWHDPDPERWPLSVRMWSGVCTGIAPLSVYTGWRQCTHREDGRSPYLSGTPSPSVGIPMQQSNRFTVSHPSVPVTEGTSASSQEEEWENVQSRYQHARLDHVAYSDLLRVALLTKYGGVWVDAAWFPLRPLDNWLCPLFREGPLHFAFCRSNDTLVECWLLAATVRDDV